jgi:hypothetical protein
MNQAWWIAPLRRRRLRTRMWHNGFIILLPVLLCVVSIAFWCALITQMVRSVTSQADYEDEQLCIKFGFPRGTDKHNACKLDLLDLRRNDEDLIARTSLP